MIGDPHVRHSGTIGGSIANNDPAADYPAALLALGATIVTNSREIAADKFFTGLFETALERRRDRHRGAVHGARQGRLRQIPQPGLALRHHRRVRRQHARTACASAVTGSGESGVFRAKEIEAALSKTFEPAALDGVKIASDGLMGDIHATPEYRANLIVVMAKRAVAQANG